MTTENWQKGQVIERSGSLIYENSIVLIRKNNEEN